MAQRASVLVVASVTADSPQVLDALASRAAQGPLHATLVLPCDGPGLGSRDAAQARLNEVLARWRAAGLDDVDGIVGDQQPIVAVLEAWDPKRYDEIVVSTLPGHASEWLRWDVPHRIARATDARVTHVVASTAAEAPRPEPAPPRERPPLGPLSVLTWGHPQEETRQERERRLRASRR